MNSVHSGAPFPDEGTPPARLPVLNLLALAMAGFITILTEVLPAGLLLQMSGDFNISQALVGQLISVYAAGSLMTAIPLMTLTQGMRRRRLLLIAVGGFIVVNTITALSTSYALTLAARFCAGVFAGLVWALLVGYASRMAPPQRAGRAIALSGIGTPLALAAGVPLGTWLGVAVGWRVTFGLTTVLSVLLVVWIVVKMPDFPGQGVQKRLSPGRVLLLPGVRSVLLTTLVFVLAHNILYTYIAPVLVRAGLEERIDAVLFLFGLSSLVGIWIVGALIDRFLRSMVLASIALFALSVLVLGLWSTTPAIVCLAVGLWGLAFGGAPTLLQTALAKSAGDHADVAQSMLVTAWNSAIAGGGLLGGVLLQTAGTPSFPWTIALLLAGTFLVVRAARRHGFPPA